MPRPAERRQQRGMDVHDPPIDSARRRRGGTSLQIARERDEVDAVFVEQTRSRALPLLGACLASSTAVGMSRRSARSSAPASDRSLATTSTTSPPRRSPSGRNDRESPGGWIRRPTRAPRCAMSSRGFYCRARGAGSASRNDRPRRRASAAVDPSPRARALAIRRRRRRHVEKDREPAERGGRSDVAPAVADEHRARRIDASGRRSRRRYSSSPGLRQSHGPGDVAG